MRRRVDHPPPLLVEVAGHSLMAVVVVLATLHLAGCAHVHTAGSAPAARFSAIYLDMDGTALGPDHEVRPATIAALERYRACGGLVGIATGRTFGQVERYLGDIKPNLPIVLFNGAVSMTPDGRTTLSVVVLPTDLTPALWPAVSSIEGVRGVVLHYSDKTLTDRDSALFREFLDRSAIRTDGIIGIQGGPPLEPPVKILVFFEEERVDEVEARLRALVALRGRVVLSSPHTLEVLPPDVNKATPIRAALGAVGVDPRDALIFGDSNNDVEMLSEFGAGIAMGNCSLKACEAALLRTDDNASDAIAAIIDRVAAGARCVK